MPSQVGSFAIFDERVVVVCSDGASAGEVVVVWLCNITSSGLLGPEAVMRDALASETSTVMTPENKRPVSPLHTAEYGSAKF